MCACVFIYGSLYYYYYYCYYDDGDDATTDDDKSDVCQLPHDKSCDGRVQRAAATELRHHRIQLELNR